MPYRRNDEDTLTIGVDPSSTNCGIAVYLNGKYEHSFAQPFKGTFSMEKFNDIIDFFNVLFEAEMPDVVVIEEPQSVRGAKTTKMLNRIVGAIYACARSYSMFVDFIPASTVKGKMEYKTKEESIALGSQIKGAPCDTDDESDAIMVVESYMKKVL